MEIGGYIMYNFDQEPERRHLVDESGLNTFLSKLYGLMALAVLVSAVSSYLTMTVFAKQMLNLMNHHPWAMWFLLLLPIALTLIINFNATRSPGMSFVLLMLTAIVYGVTFAFIAGAYTGEDIASAASVFIVMAILGTVTKRDLSRIGSYASAALIGLIVAMLINLFLKNPTIDYIFSFIAVIIFTILTAWDAQRMKNIYLQFGGEISANGLAVLGALQLYLDFVNLFLQFLDIFGSNDND